MNTTHTPAPWTYSDGMVWKAHTGTPIAKMDREPGNGTSPVERDCNAKLIAFTPEMFNLLKRISQHRINGEKSLPALLATDMVNQINARLKD